MSIELETTIEVLNDLTFVYERRGQSHEEAFGNAITSVILLGSPSEITSAAIDKIEGR